jgi:hypothetical protein
LTGRRVARPDQIIVDSLAQDEGTYRNLAATVEPHPLALGWGNVFRHKLTRHDVAME